MSYEVSLKAVWIAASNLQILGKYNVGVVVVMKQEGIVGCDGFGQCGSQHSLFWV